MHVPSIEQIEQIPFETYLCLRTENLGARIESGRRCLLSQDRAEKILGTRQV